MYLCGGGTHPFCRRLALIINEFGDLGVDGEILRAGAVPTVELRAGMVIGHGSLSWRIVRDLAARLPAMVVPLWLRSQSQPIALEDALFALESALFMPIDGSCCYDIPGPETLTGEQILTRIAALMGMRPLMIRFPALTPRLSSYWLRLVTGAEFQKMLCTDDM